MNFSAMDQQFNIFNSHWVITAKSEQREDSEVSLWAPYKTLMAMNGKVRKPDDGDLLRVFTETADDLSLMMEQYGIVAKVVFMEIDVTLQPFDFCDAVSCFRCMTAM